MDASEVGLFPLVGAHGGGDKVIGGARDECAQSRPVALKDVDVEGRLHDAGSGGARKKCVLGAAQSGLPFPKWCNKDP